jgi:hypothetical protein
LNRGERALAKCKNSSYGLFIAGFIFLFVFSGYRSPALALNPEVISFNALGYTHAITLKGVNPEFTVSIPAPSGGIDPKASFVRLHLEPAPLLDEHSSVRLLLYGEPVKTVTIQSLRTNGTVTVPIPALPPGELFIPLSIHPYLYISHNFCMDLPTGNLFLTVGHESFFQIAPLIPDHSIREFFRPFYDQLLLHIPSGLDQQQLEAALWLYSILAYQFRERQTRILWQQGEGPVPQGGARVSLHTRADGPDIEREGMNLQVRATAAAVQALSAALETTTPGYQPALLSRGLSVEAVEPRVQTPPVTRRSLQELGFHDRTLRGLGTQGFRVPFTLAQLGGRPKELTLMLKATFTPVDAKQGERLNGQVYFNHTLVQTYNLTGETHLQGMLSLPASLLRRNNHLDVLFTHTPTERECQNGPAGFTAQLHGDSYLAWNGERGPTEDLDDLPHVFLPPGQMIVETQQPALLAGAAYLLGVISRLGRQAIQPELLAAESLGDWSSLPQSRQHQSPAWRLLAIAPGRIGFPAPIRLEQSFEIYNPINQRRLLRAHPADPIGILQYFPYQGVPTLWLSWWGTGSELATELAQALANPQLALASQLSGNVVTASGSRADPRMAATVTKVGDRDALGSETTGPRIQMWNLGGLSLRIAYPEDLNWQLLLRRYRSLLIALVVLLGGVIAWRFYRRLGRPPTATPPRSGPMTGGESA